MASYIAKKEHGIYNCGIEIWKSCTSYHQVLRACCFPPRSAAAPSITADHHCSTRINMLCRMWLSPVAKLPERHHFYACRALCAKLMFFSCFSTFFDFSILNPMDGQPSTLAYPFDHWVPSSLPIIHLRHRSY